MERELWCALYKLVRICDPSPWWSLNRFHDWVIVSVYLWAVIHDRPTSWSCDESNWPKDLWDSELPSQPTMSRRLQTTEVQRLLAKVEQCLPVLATIGFVMSIDGKPLIVGSHSKDPDALWGRVRRGWAKGYKLHAVYGEGRVLTWEVTPLNEAESNVATRLIPSLRRGGGYILGDSAYDSNPLHEVASAHGYQLVAKRKRDGTGLGHRRHSPGRLRSIALLDQQFGKMLYTCREEIERKFAWLTNHGGGLAPLPNWVRRLPRVRMWVQSKILIHAAYVSLTFPRTLLACE